MPDTARLGRAIAAGALALTAVFGVAGCQYQSLQQYTPADGVNTTVGGVMVRNLVILVTEPGEGILLGTLITDSEDSLRSVSGTALLPNGSPGAALQVTSSDAVAITPNEPTILLDQAIQVSSSDLRAGLTATVELTLEKAGKVSLVVPVLDRESPEYAGLEIPSPSASPTTSG